MTADILSDVLQTVRLRGALFYWVDATPPWTATVPPTREIAAAVMPGVEHVIEFHLVVEGACWVGLTGEAPERAGAGDVIVFPRGDAHALTSDRDLPSPPPAARPTDPQGRPFSLHCGPAGPPPARFVCGFLGCDARPFDPLLLALPRMLRLPGDHGPLGQLMRLVAAETARPRPGGEALRARLAETMFLEAVRDYAAGLPTGSGGWLAGLRDPAVGRVLALLHARAAHSWTLEALAREAGLSRTGLHERFTALVGLPPMQYLARWRMQMAATRLAQGGERIAAVARAVGYDSEAAFNRAFKRLVGTPPATWRRDRAPRWPAAEAPEVPAA